jgi:abhydrolase domain-containing protein 6
MGLGMWRAIAIVAVTLAALAVAFYLRPLSAIHLARDAVLLSRGVESGAVEVGPHRLHYLAQGEGAPLVILPGLLASAVDASPLLNAFAANRRAIALDLLGQGKSSRPEIDYAISDQSAAVIRFLEQTQRGPVDLVGVSMGGWIALDVAAKRPDLVRSLILADSGGLRFETSITPDTFAPQTVGQLNQLIALQFGEPPRPMPDFIARDMLRQLGDRQWMTQRAARSMATWHEAYDGRLESIRTPTLVYWGEEDRVIPIEAGRRLAAGIQDSRLVVAEGCGHLAVLECRDGFVAAVEQFLDEQ